MGKKFFMSMVALVLTVLVMIFNKDVLGFAEVVILYYVINIYLNIE